MGQVLSLIMLLFLQFCFADTQVFQDILRNQTVLGKKKHFLLISTFCFFSILLLLSQFKGGVTFIPIEGNFLPFAV